MKTYSLSGATLDYWCARAEGIPAEQLEIRQVPRTDQKICVRVPHLFAAVAMPYSTDWTLCGPLVGEHIKTFGHVGTHWEAQTHGGAEGFDVFSPMVAICRAVVRQAFGDEVEDLPCE